jgi:hypothetical protein
MRRDLQGVLNLSCPECYTLMQVPRTLNGRLARCSVCSAVFRIGAVPPRPAKMASEFFEGDSKSPEPTESASAPSESATPIQQLNPIKSQARPRRKRVSYGLTGSGTGDARLVGAGAISCVVGLLATFVAIAQGKIPLAGPILLVFGLGKLVLGFSRGQD